MNILAESISPLLTIEETASVCIGCVANRAAAMIEALPSLSRTPAAITYSLIVFVVCEGCEAAAMIQAPTTYHT